MGSNPVVERWAWRCWHGAVTAAACVVVVALAACSSDTSHPAPRNSPHAVTIRFRPRVALTPAQLADARSVMQRRLDAVTHGAAARVDGGDLVLGVDTAAAALVREFGAPGKLVQRVVLGIAGRDAVGVGGKRCAALVDNKTWWWDTKRSACYHLGPVLLDESSVVAARADYQANDKGWGITASYRSNVFVEKIAAPYVNRQIAIVSDDVVLSAPTINPGIAGPEVRIAGTFSEREAKRLAAIFASGALPTRFDIVG